MNKLTTYQRHQIASGIGNAILAFVALAVCFAVWANGYDNGRAWGLDKSAREYDLRIFDERANTAEITKRAEESSVTIGELERAVAAVREDNTALVARLAALKPQPRTGRKVKRETAKTYAYTGSIPTLIRRVGRLSGFGEADLAALGTLANRESSFNPNAHSKTSECHGLFQLDAGKAHGHPWRDPIWNTTRAIAYIKSRYGSPRAALAHSYAKGWY